MRPNIIVFMTDHQRGDTLLEGNKVKTPNVDKFRKQSVLFSNCYTTAPHCCPARASFFTGLYPSEHGVWNNVDVSNTLSRGLFDNTPLFSQDLKANGYNLYYSGKWHVSAEEGPDKYGFDPIHHECGRYHKYAHVPSTKEWSWYSEGTMDIDKGDEERTEARIIRPGYRSYIQYGLEENPYNDTETTQAAIDKLDDIDTENPFFMFVGPLGPHDPYFVPKKFLDMYDPDDIELPANYNDDMEDKPNLYKRTKQRYSQLTDAEQKESVRRFYAFCSFEDDLFGRLVNKVEEKGLMENTIILYVSDHGDYIGSHGLWAKGLPCFKEAYNICALAGGGPVANKGKVYDELVSITDWAPTFLELAGIKANRRFEGKSLVPFISGEEPKEWREYHFAQSNGNEVYGIQRSVWSKKWKYVFNSFDFDELYNLEEDPGELHNLLHGIDDVTHSEYAPIVKEMCEKMWQFAYDNKDNCVNPYIMTAFAPYGPGVIFPLKRSLQTL